MKVLLSNFHAGWGGQPAMVRMLAAGLRGAGVEVRVACPPGSRLAEACRDDGTPTFEGALFRKSSYLRDTWRDTRALAEHLRDGRYDLVHSHGSQDTWSLVFARVLFRIAVPHVATRHNTKSVPPHPFNRLLWGRWVDRLVCVSGGTRRVFEPFFPPSPLGGLLGPALDPARVSVIHPSFDLARFEAGPPRDEARRALGLDPAAPVAGVFARLDPDKGHRFLFEAWGTVLRTLPDAVLLIAGEGREEPALRAQVERLRIGRSVRFLGFRTDVPLLTRALDLAVLPAVGTDSSSTICKEAGVCGVPVVATEIGGIREIVEDGVTGCVVPPGDSQALAAPLLDLLGDPDRRREMGAAARARVLALFAPEAMCRAYLSLYREVAGGPKGGRLAP